MGLATGEGADDFGPFPQRGRHIHGRAGGIIGIGAGAAGAILAAQGAVDIVPAGIVLAQIRAIGVVNHHALLVSDIDAVLRLLFEVAVDHRIDGILVEAGEGAGQPPVHHIALLQIIEGERRQQLGHVHQSILGGAAHPGFDLLDEDLQHEPGGQCEDQQQPAQQLQAESHASSRL